MADRVPFHARPSDFGGLGHLLTPEARRGGPGGDMGRNVVADYLEDQEAYHHDPEGVRRQVGLLRDPGQHVVVDDQGRVRAGRYTLDHLTAAEHRLLARTEVDDPPRWDWHDSHPDPRFDYRDGPRHGRVMYDATPNVPHRGVYHVADMPGVLHDYYRDQLDDESRYLADGQDSDDWQAAREEDERHLGAVRTAPVEEVDRDHPSERTAPERLARATAAVLRQARDAAAPPKKKYGCLMIPVTGGAADAALAMGKAIPEGDLGDDGVETFMHITALHGFHDEVGPDDVRNALADFGPVKYRFGELSAFYGKDTGRDYDVLKFGVESPDLRRLHDALKKLPNTQKFDEFKPHMTVAYVKAGLADKYIEKFAGKDDAVGAGEATEAVFSDAKKNRTTLPLGGETPTRKARDPHAAVRLKRAGEPVRKSADHLALVRDVGDRHRRGADADHAKLVHADYLEDAGYNALPELARRSVRMDHPLDQGVESKWSAQRPLWAGDGLYPVHTLYHSRAGVPIRTDVWPVHDGVGNYAFRVAAPHAEEADGLNTHPVGYHFVTADPDLLRRVAAEADEGSGREGLLKTIGTVGHRMVKGPINTDLPTPEEPQRYAAYRAPAGGAVVRGVYYVGGRLLPDLQRFLPRVRQIAGRKAKAKRPTAAPIVVGFGPQDAPPAK